MKNLIEKLEWWFDYNVIFLLYNPNKIDRYYRFMEEKWEIKGSRFPFQIPEVLSQEINIKSDSEVEIDNIVHLN